MDNETKKSADCTEKKAYISGFVTGCLTVTLIASVINFGPALYSTYITGKMDHKTKAQIIYNVIKKHYIEDIDKEEMYEGIYLGMTSMPTDNYSYYMSAESAKKYNEETDGNYVGIGIVIKGDAKTGDVTVDTVYKPSPAYDSGIKKGDILVSVSGVEISAINMNEAANMVRGPENTTVDLVVYRPDEDKNYDITCCRKAVDIPTVFTQMLDDGIGYLQITAFDGVTAEQYKNAVESLKQQGMTKMIIDLRDNPGGLLSTVSEIADTLIPKGTLTYTEDKYGKKNYVYTDNDYLNIPLAVIVNGNSASASELLTGAVKDTGVGKIVGENTFGKGVVQTPFPLSDGSIVKLTTARYYTPNGTCIDGIGIKPDEEVKAADDFEMVNLNDDNAVLDIANDIQLKKAIEVLK